MKIPISTFLPCLLVSASVALAGNYSATSDTAAGESQSAFPFEFDLEYAYIGDSDVERSFRKVNDFDENYSLARFIYTPRIKVGILRLGARWERFEFGLPDETFVRRLVVQPLIGPPGIIFLNGPTQIPETLQSVSAIVGLDTQFSDSLLFRFEAQPGFYGTDDLDGNTFNIPFVLGGTYIYSSDLQFIFGVSVDYERKYPVFPGGGIRWRFASQWVLNAALPTPRLEFEMNKNFMIYLGADLKGSTFRVDDRFRAPLGDERLNNAVLTYTELRTGLGVDWKITPDIKLSVEGGYLPYREFDYHRADVRYTHEKGAPYGSIALRAAF